MPVTIGPHTFATLDSSAEVAAVKTLAEDVTYSGMTDEAIAAAVLTRPMVANQLAAPHVPDPAKVNDANLIGKLSTAQLAAIPEDSLSRVGAAIAAKDIAYLSLAVTVWTAKAYIDDATRLALLTDITATIDDPSHPTQVPGDSPAMVALGRQPSSLTGLDIQKAKELG